MSLMRRCPISLCGFKRLSISSYGRLVMFCLSGAYSALVWSVFHTCTEHAPHLCPARSTLVWNKRLSSTRFFPPFCSLNLCHSFNNWQVCINAKLAVAAVNRR